MDTGFRCVVTESDSKNSAKTLPDGTPFEAIAEPVKVPAPATSAQPVKPVTAGNKAETEYLYIGDFRTGQIHKINTADGSYECFIKTGEIKRGIGAGLGFDSHGNLYSNHGGTVVKIAPDKTVTEIVTGLANGTCLTVDSNDNLYIGDYLPGLRLFRIDAKSPYLGTPSSPIKLEYAKDASDKPDFTKYTMTPAGAMTELDNNKTGAYGLSYDKNGNVYYTGLCQPFFKYDSAGNRVTMCKSGKALVYWERDVIIDPHGDFFVLGTFEIAKATPDGRVIARMAPGVDWHHSVAIVMDSKGNIYQANPADPHSPTFSATGEAAVVYKYTLDGLRSVLCAHCGTAPFYIAIWPRTKFPVTEQAK